MRPSWKSRNVNSKVSHWIYLLAGVSTIALAAVAITLSTRAVHADARIPGAASSPPPIQSAIPLSPAPRKTSNPSQADPFKGIATWYGPVLNGHHTASGERFNMYAMTACHPTLPFGSRVRVLNLNNHRSVVVRINDRGELDAARIIDISYAAAQKLHIIKSGVAPVAVEVISLGPPRHRN
jgi:rare lipoprotein A